VLFQARQELIEQIVELIGVIDKKRVIPGGWSANRKLSTDHAVKSW